MGILFDSVKKANLHQEMKHKFVIERLMKLGITHSQHGQSIHDLDYEEAKYELVIAEMRQVDIDNPEHKWFK
jgi:hypothetical protein